MKLFALLVAVLALPAWAQSPSLAELQEKLVGSWAVTMPVDPRPRTLAIKTLAQAGDNRYAMTGSMNFSDAKEAPFSEGEVAPTADGVHLKFTSASGAAMTATLRPDGSFIGSSKFRGNEFPLIIVKSGGAPVTEFDGQWKGHASGTGNCWPGNYDLTIKDGKVSGRVIFSGTTREGSGSSKVTGTVQRDKSVMLVLTKEQPESRDNYFRGTFSGNEFEGYDKGVNCHYQVKLKKAG